MATNLELALMSGRAYQSTRKDVNWFPVPDGWTDMQQHASEPSGFEAVSFRRGTGSNTEIVISFAGTYLSITDLRDGLADSDLAAGIPTNQLKEAALYYCQVKAANPNATITLTGHSLGGGLAALLGVFFNVQAVTFDQAPFLKSAEFNGNGLIVYKDLRDYLLIHGVSEFLLQPFFEYGTIDSSGLSGTNKLAEREGKVSNIRVDGEFLSSAPIGLYHTIGTTLPANILTHGPYSNPSIDMHSISLLTAFLQSDQSAAASGKTLREVTKKLTDLLGMIFDENLYEFTTDTTNTTKTNFLELLVRHEAGVQGSFAADHMLDRFTSDLWKIAQAGGLTMANSNLTKALTAFAMQAYYNNRLTAGEELFNTVNVSGGIHFNRSKVSTDLDGASGAKGYALYFTNYLATLSIADRNLILAQLPNLLDWYIQAGSGSMTATGGNLRAFMLGGSGDDTLTGGSLADVLVGNKGADDYDVRRVA